MEDGNEMERRLSEGRDEPFRRARPRWNFESDDKSDGAARASSVSLRAAALMA